MGATGDPPVAPFPGGPMTPVKHAYVAQGDLESCGMLAAKGAGIGAVIGLVTGALAGLAAGGEGRRLKGAGYGALVAVPLMAGLYGGGVYLSCQSIRNIGT
jgi:hypothetical protein